MDVKIRKHILQNRANTKLENNKNSIPDLDEDSDEEFERKINEALEALAPIDKKDKVKDNRLIWD